MNSILINHTHLYVLSHLHSGLNEAPTYRKYTVIILSFFKYKTNTCQLLQILVSIDDDKGRQLRWRGQEVVFHIDNQSEDIVLIRGTYNLLEGKKIYNFCPVILPGHEEKMNVKASSILRKQLRCYLIYELVLKNQDRMPIMKNQRVFLAVEVYSETSSAERTTSAVVFAVKSSRFTGDNDDADWLHKDLLRHHVIQDKKIFRFNINGRWLEMVVNIEGKDPARIKVELKSIDEYIKYGPVFHRANAFA
jgi:hypothetical protein